MLPLSKSLRLTQKLFLFLSIFFLLATIILVYLNWGNLSSNLPRFTTPIITYNGDNRLEDQFGLNLAMKKIYMQILLCIVASIISFMSYRFVLGLRKTEPLWDEVAILSLTFTIGAGIIYWLATVYIYNEDMNLFINNSTDNDNFKEERLNYASQAKEPPPIFIPTGVFLQSVEFTNSNNCIITAYVWQRYSRNIYDSVSKGFTLPEAQEEIITEIYKKEYKDEIVHGWQVKATVREVFSFSTYPFDYQNLWLRFWHADFYKNVILTPDLASYHFDRDQFIGVERDIVLEGWHICSTFFGYRYNSYSTTFGLKDYVGAEFFPELYFNVIIQRNFMGIFISDLVPIMMVFTLLFIIVLVTHKVDLETDFFKFNVMEVVSMITALVFVVVLAHVELRKKISTDEAVYIEYFFFVVYIALFMVVVNYMIVNKNVQIKLLQYRNNYIAKMLFLPLIMGCMFLITWIIFY